ncbi:hypothetical protein BC826DRAFT_1028914 [Russula brevipes]|nr:hypothetical protein BC826DRAFT_1028914 [Russula brevipes]
MQAGLPLSITVILTSRPLLYWRLTHLCNSSPVSSIWYLLHDILSLSCTLRMTIINEVLHGLRTVTVCRNA